MLPIIRLDKDPKQANEMTKDFLASFPKDFCEDLFPVNLRIQFSRDSEKRLYWLIKNKFYIDYIWSISSGPYAPYGMVGIIWSIYMVRSDIKYDENRSLTVLTNFDSLYTGSIKKAQKST